MQQQQSPLLTADKDAEGQLLSYRLSLVTEYNTGDEWWNQVKFDISLTSYTCWTQKNMFLSYQASCYVTSGHSSLRFLSGVCAISPSLKANS